MPARPRRNWYSERSLRALSALTEAHKQKAKIDERHGHLELYA
jgi:hypothetical protein